MLDLVDRYGLALAKKAVGVPLGGFDEVEVVQREKPSWPGRERARERGLTGLSCTGHHNGRHRVEMHSQRFGQGPCA